MEKNQTRIEDIASATTHGVGIALSIAATFVLVWLSALQADPWKIVSSCVFGLSMIITYAASTIYHAVAHPPHKKQLQVFDHAAIYLLIAGTYTPITLVTLRGDWGFLLFGVIWTCAILGILFEFFTTKRYLKLTLGFYLVMGWAAIAAIVPIYHDLPWHGFLFLIAGGLSYSLGVIFYVWENLKYNHAIWHVFVMTGTICHFFVIVLYVI